MKNRAEVKLTHQYQCKVKLEPYYIMYPLKTPKPRH